jgi:hypothetical protein
MMAIANFMGVLGARFASLVHSQAKIGANTMMKKSANSNVGKSITQPEQLLLYS